MAPLVGTAALQQRIDVLAQALPPAAASEPIPDDCWRDPIGVVTRGGAEGAPQLGQRHDAMAPFEVEWLALLTAVLAARETLTVVELGAGRGPWLVRAGVAWRRLYPTAPLTLIGVEGEPTHVEMLHQHIALNRLDAPTDVPADIRIMSGAVGSTDGETMFEVAQRPTAEWGTRRAGDSGLAGLPRVRPAGTVRVTQWSLTTLLRDLNRVDLLHIDIQGDELAVLEAAKPALQAQVRHLVVGTHGRSIEGALIELLPSLGFGLAADQACRYSQARAAPTLIEDGAQFWINARM